MGVYIHFVPFSVPELVHIHIYIKDVCVYNYIIYTRKFYGITVNLLVNKPALRPHVH